jgi:superfamily I DNA and/or RNA helicase
MDLSVKCAEPYLQKTSTLDVEFDNLFVGSERIFSFENGTDRYSISLKPKILGLEPKVLLNVEIAGCRAEISLDGLSNLEAIDKKFAGIDPMLFNDEIKVLLLNCLFEQHIASFSSKVGFTLCLKEISCSETTSTSYAKEIGVNIVKNDAMSVSFNMKLNDDLLKILSSTFEKVETTGHDVDDKLPFEWYLEVGKTSIGIQDYRDLEEYDIVLLDEDANIRTGKYEIKGLNGMKFYGKIEGNNLILEN